MSDTAARFGWWSEPIVEDSPVIASAEAARARLAPFDLSMAAERIDRPGDCEPRAMARTGGAQQAEIDAAFERGLLQGREEAQLAAAQQARQELADVISALHTATLTLNASKDALLDEIASQLPRLALATTTAVLGAELLLHPEATKEAIKRAVSCLPVDVEITVRLNPADANQLAETVERRSDDRPWATVEKWYGLDSRISVIEDSAIERGGAVAVAGATRVDTQISTTVARIAEALELPVQPQTVSKTPGSPVDEMVKGA